MVQFPWIWRSSKNAVAMDTILKQICLDTAVLLYIAEERTVALEIIVCCSIIHSPPDSETLKTLLIEADHKTDLSDILQYGCRFMS